MKKSYETAEMNIVFFAKTEVILASSEAPFVPNITEEDDQTEIL